MSTLNLNVSEFENLILIFLMDETLNPERIKNDIMKDFINDKGSIIKSSLIKAYLDSDTEIRLKYKYIKGVFEGKSTSVQEIRIKNGKEKEEKKPGLIKKVINKVLRKEELSIEDMEVLNEIIELED
jgi:hypothetical protein